LMLGVTSPADGLEGDVAPGAPDSRIKAVVNYFGPTDLAAKDIPDISKPLVNDFLGGTPLEKPEAAAKASPLTFVSKDDAPVLTFQGTKDPLVPATQAIKLAEAMSAAGVPGRSVKRSVSSNAISRRGKLAAVRNLFVRAASARLHGRPTR
jgi:fermentation-respiration switch protein FrsA (DUF1100 family)